MTVLNQEVWKKIEAKDYFSNLEIPDDWDSLEDFVDWYIDNRMPMMIPWNAEVIRSDDAVAICTFRKGHYQVEFYLEYPRMWIRKHAHPRMEVITMSLGAGSLTPKDSELPTSTLWGTLTKKLPAGDYHGGDSSGGIGNGFITLAFQRWEDPSEMTSAAVQWKGELQGPYQEKLIKRKKPDVLVEPGYADVSSPAKET